MPESPDRLDRIEIALAAMTETLQRTAELHDARLRQHDLELDDHDERVEALERIIANHDTNMTELKEVQKDIRQILQMMTRRFAGE
jgi:archaellum component FlaC